MLTGCRLAVAAQEAGGMVLALSAQVDVVDAASMNALASQVLGQWGAIVLYSGPTSYIAGEQVRVDGGMLRGF